MPVISVSLPAPLVEDIDRHVAEEGYKGRSDLVRSALREKFATEEKPSQRSHVHGSVTVSYPHGKEARMSEVRHAFHDVVLSLMHTHCEPETCMDVLIVGGDRKRVEELQATFTRRRDVLRSRLVIVA